jgi:hypothetical protein
MKKLLVFVVFLTLGAALFAVDISLDADAETDFTGMTPAIGVGIGLENVTLMAGVSFSFFYDNYKYAASYSVNDYAKRTIAGGVYAGAAPVVFSNEQWELSAPLTVQFRFGSIGGNDYKDGSHFVSENQLKRSITFGFDCMAGGRATYMLTKRWGLYAGFLWALVSYDHYQDTRYKNRFQTGGTYELKESVVNVFNHGLAQWGVKFKI